MSIPVASRKSRTNRRQAPARKLRTSSGVIRALKKIHKNGAFPLSPAPRLSETFWIVDVTQSRILCEGAGYENVWGRKADRTNPENWFQALRPEDRKRASLLTGPCGGNEVFQVTDLDGNNRWVRVRAEGALDRSRVTFTAQDITGFKEAETRLSLLNHALESATEMICVTDMHDRFVYLNQAFLDRYGYRKEELLGRKPDIVFSPDNPPALMNNILEQSRSCGWSGELVDRCKHGKDFPIFLRTSQVKNLAGEIIGLIGVAHDLTAKKQAEAGLRELAAIVANSGDAIIGQRLDGVIASWNKSAARIYQYSAQEAVGAQISLLIPADRQQDYFSVMQKLRHGRQVEHLETQHRKKDGSMIEVSLSLSPIKDGAGNINGISVIARDITQQKLLEKQLLDIAMRERRRLGHDLHDGLGQYLAGIAFRAKALAESLSLAGSAHSIEANELATLVSGAIAQTHSLAKGLDPIEIEARGLISALQNLAEDAQTMFNVRCTFYCNQTELRLTPDAGLALFRIAQESLHNGVNHGKAKAVQIQLARTQRRLRLTVYDDGTGFKSGSTRNGGMGLHIMSYRARAIGGVLRINSGEDQGTEVSCVVPLACCLKAPVERTAL